MKTPDFKDPNYNPRALALIKRMIAIDANQDEFEMFIATARARKLDPLRRQIYCLVYSKNDPKKRRMSIIVGIDGFRTVADRTGNYRPDDKEPRLELDPAAAGPFNPIGLLKATVSVFKHSHGEWHRVTAAAHWDEYVPIEEEWITDEETGKRKRSGQKKIGGKWSSMPRLMLAKVAEALALRKAWPDDFSNVHSAEEMDRATVELSATEIMEEGARQLRLEKIGGSGLIVDWCDGSALDSVPPGAFADRVLARLEEMSPVEAAVFADRNRIALREFWAHSAGDALELKKAIEARSAAVEDEADEPPPVE